ncbi:hypothetical protein [Stenotrophomonas sp. SMYL86]|uniref:hypothetical protein n=1 Tax=Stenotrophomonas sp. SMYL86 TaxID=3076044 RepID=UPI002E792C80|nr:hypothetical protein [Stenotrophomonas sp. SMYL86]
MRLPDNLSLMGFDVPVQDSSTSAWTKEDIAEALLNSACELFQRGGHAVAVWHLAAAAEEIFGAVLQHRGESSDRAITKLANRLTAKIPGIDATDVYNFVYEGKRAIKHYNRPNEAVVIAETDQVVYTLAMALLNRVATGVPVSRPMWLVLDWLLRRDLERE